MAKYNGTNISNYKLYANQILDDVETYKMVLDRRLKIFPMGFWDKPYSYQSSAEIFKYLVEKRLKLDKEGLMNALNAQFFTTHRIRGMLELFGRSPYRVLDNAYPGKFKPWELRNPPRCWDDETVIEAVKWLIEDKLKFSRQDIIEKYNYELLANNKLTYVGNKIGVYRSLEMAYPGEFKPWDLKNVSVDFWNDKNNIRDAMRWLIEKELKWNRNDIIEKYSGDIINNSRFKTLANRRSIFELLDIAYPGEFKIYELKACHKDVWTKERIKEAVKWLIEDRLKLDIGKDRNKIIKIYTRKFLIENGLNSVAVYGLYNSMELTYPGRFKKGDFSRVNRNKIKV